MDLRFSKEFQDFSSLIPDPEDPLVYVPSSFIKEYSYKLNSRL
jgi:hypothetical protein